MGTGSNPSDLVFINQTKESRTLSVSVTKQGESTPIFDKTVQLRPGSRQRKT